MNTQVTMSGRFQYRQGSGLPRHKHPEDFQVQLVCQGSATILIDSEVYEAKAGDVYFIRRGGLHEFKATAPDGFRTLEIKFKTDEAELEEAAFSIHPYFQDDERLIYSVFSNMILEGQKKEVDYKLMNRGLLLQAIVEMKRICESAGVLAFDERTEANPSSSTLSPVIKAVTDYTYANLDKNFSLKDMAQACGYNQDYIYRTIKKELGITAIAYVNNIKFNQAKELIRSTELSLSEIAWSLGFESIQYFSNFFKKHAKISPSEYSYGVRNTTREDY